MSEAQEQYREALKARRTGVVSKLGRDATFLQVKPEYYADGRVLSEDVLKTFNTFREQYPPYGLVDRRGNSLIRLDAENRPWRVLTPLLRTTAHTAFEVTTPSITACPYHEVLARTLGPTRPALKPIDYDEYGLDTLRNVSAPGGELNSPLFTSLIRRLPSIQKLHGSTSDPEMFARNSVTLLREPLAHPQQWAAGFVYSLGSLTELLSDEFLNDELALEYTKVETTPAGKERLAWAIPTADFLVRQEVRVTNRVEGSELDFEGDHITIYPVGTRLGDIRVDEPTLGCPGNLLAFAIWDRTVDVVVGENLWQRDDEEF